MEKKKTFNSAIKQYLAQNTGLEANQCASSSERCCFWKQSLQRGRTRGGWLWWLFCGNSLACSARTFGNGDDFIHRLARHDDVFCGREWGDILSSSSSRTLANTVEHCALKKLFLPISWQWSQRCLRLVYLHHRNLVGNGFVLLHPSSPSAVANNRLCDRNTDLSHSHCNDASTLRQIQVKGKVCVYLCINLCQAGWRGRAQCMGDKHQIMVWPISFSIALLGHYHRNGTVGLSGSYMQEYAPRALLST